MPKSQNFILCNLHKVRSGYFTILIWAYNVCFIVRIYNWDLVSNKKLKRLFCHSAGCPRSVLLSPPPSMPTPIITHTRNGSMQVQRVSLLPLMMTLAQIWEASTKIGLMNLKFKMGPKTHSYI